MILDDVMVMALARNPLRFRAAGADFDGTTTVTKPAGIAVGDLVFVADNQYLETLSTAGGDAWTRVVSLAVASGVNLGVWAKVLTATDVANAWNFSGVSAGGVAWAYAGPDNAMPTLRDTTVNGTGQTSLTLSGFTPAAGSRGAVTVLRDRDHDSGIVVPPGFTMRAEFVIGGQSKMAVADYGDYSGGDVVWTDLLGSLSEEEGGALLELNGA